MSRKLTDAEKRKLADKLLGTCDSTEAALEYLELDADFDADAAEDGLLDLNVERCKGCDWWHESGELAGERDGEPGYCDQCREPDDDGD